MDIREAKSILMKLLDNIDPVTNEQMQDNSILGGVVIQEAFRVLLDFDYEGEPTQEEIEEKQQHNLANGYPLNHGSSWTSCDKELLRRTYTSEQPVSELAEQFGRTEYAIECQLFILALVESNPLRDSDGEPIDDPSHADKIDLLRIRQEVLDNGLSGTYITPPPWL